MTFCNLQAGEKQRDPNSAEGERHEEEREVAIDNYDYHFER